MAKKKINKKRVVKKVAKKRSKKKAAAAKSDQAKGAAASAAPSGKRRTKKKRRTSKRQGDAQERIERLALDVASQTEKGRDPFIDIPTRSLSNISYNATRGIIELGGASQRRSFFNLSQAKKFMQTMLVAAGSSELIHQRKTTSIRDLFYHCKHTIAGARENTFDEQTESDAVIEDLEVALGSLREELGLFAEPKGAMVGPMTIVDQGDTIDLAHMGSGGYAIPSIVEERIVKFRRHKAKFVLLIEKGAVWRRFNEDRFWERHSCMIVHGGGQPSRGVRRLLWRLSNELGLPVYVLVDNDPWGYYIYSVVKQGSINLAFESARMAVPDARFIGMSSFDAEAFDLSSEVTISLTAQDIRRAKEIREYPWFTRKKAWRREINHMLKLGVKLELEALSSKDFSFITETYLPKKLADGVFLD